MPKRVDHDLRRQEIVEATWRIIARGGFQAATMREIAAEAGFANGALKYYFDDKDQILAAAFQRTFFCVNERSALAMDDRTGIDAIRTLCVEMLPLDEARRIEARVAVAFWDRAASTKSLAKIHADSLAIWRKWLEDQIDSARRHGSLVEDASTEDIIDELFFFTTGMRVLSVLQPGTGVPEQQMDRLDAVLARYTRTATSELDATR